MTPYSGHGEVEHDVDATLNMLHCQLLCLAIEWLISDKVQLLCCPGG
jgi:hypothetical protein